MFVTNLNPNSPFKSDYSCSKRWLDDPLHMKQPRNISTRTKHSPNVPFAVKFYYCDILTLWCFVPMTFYCCNISSSWCSTTTTSVSLCLLLRYFVPYMMCLCDWRPHRGFSGGHHVTVLRRPHFFTWENVYNCYEDKCRRHATVLWCQNVLTGNDVYFCF